jgi:hypothetical protein
MEANMAMALTRMTRLTLAGFVLTGFGGLAACTTDDNDPGVDGDGATSSSGSGSGGSTTGSGTQSSSSSGSESTNGATSTTGGGGNSSAGTGVCASPIVLASSAPGIATFDDYDGGAILAEWSFPLGGDPALGVYAGPFGYGDDHIEGDTELPEVFDLVDGNDSSYALSVSDTDSQDYGGGMGLWISECLNASAFSGLSFWVRGNAPTGNSKLTLLMAESTPISDGDGTCDGTIDDCVQPTYSFPVSDEWAEVQVAWRDFTPGQTPDAVVLADGTNIWQIQFDIGLVWEESDSGEYAPVAGEYELVVDDLTFY